MESKVEMIEPSVNVLWQNLIALNNSLFKENEEKNKQLIDIKKKLVEVCTYILLIYGTEMSKKCARLFVSIVKILKL